MIKYSIKLMFLFFLGFTIVLIPAGYTGSQRVDEASEQGSIESSSDISAELEKETEVLEEDVDKISLQLEKVVDIIVEKYNVIMPKIKATTANIQKKIQELMDSFQEEDTAK